MAVDKDGWPKQVIAILAKTEGGKSDKCADKNIKDDNEDRLLEVS